MNRFDCHDRLKEVAQRYVLAKEVLANAVELISRDASLLEASVPTLNELSSELESLYFVRLFAVFESTIRHYWLNTVRSSRPSTEQLIDRVAVRRAMPQDTLNTVQEIRQYRNYLIHEELSGRPKTFTMDEASRVLNTYLARLPLNW